VISYHKKKKLRGKDSLIEIPDLNFEIHLYYLKRRIISLRGAP
jgi:hypothetical protein